MDEVHFHVFVLLCRANAWQIHKSLYIQIWDVINDPYCCEWWRMYVRITQLSDVRRLVSWFMEAPISIYLKSETWKRLVLISPSGLGPMQAVISQVQPEQSLLSPWLPGLRLWGCKERKIIFPPNFLWLPTLRGMPSSANTPAEPRSHNVVFIKDRAI